jgi:hypothetical protein
MAGPAVVAEADHHGWWRRQAGLVQPSLEGADGGNLLCRELAQQFQADPGCSPAGVKAAQVLAGLENGQAGGVETASGAVKVGGEVVVGRQRPPANK